MKMLNLDDYKRNRVDKMDRVTTGINIGRRHKVFIETNGVNLSALVRDLIDGMIKENSDSKSKKK